MTSGGAIVTAVLTVAAQTPPEAHAPRIPHIEWSANVLTLGDHRLDWVSAPSPNRRLPMRRLPSRLRLEADVVCTVAEGGRLRDCSVTEERPRTTFHYDDAVLHSLRGSRVVLGPDHLAVGDRTAFTIVLVREQ